MKKLITLLLLSYAINADAQWWNTRQKIGGITQGFVTNSPGNSEANSKLVWQTADSSYYDLKFPSFILSAYGSARNDGAPTSIAWFDNDGVFRRSPFPTIPAAQVQTDWNAVSGLGVLLNKPNLSLYYLASNPNGYISSVPAQSFASLTGKPTTLFGYGITDAYPLSGNPSGFLTSVTSGMVTTALGYTPVNPDGNTLQYIRGDGAKITFPAIPAAQIQSDWAQASSGAVDFIKNKPTIVRQETYSGTTNASGIFTITYPSAYSVVPNVQYNIGTGGGNKETILLTSSTTTGATFYVQLRTDVLGLLPSYSNVSGRNVDVLVTAK